MKILTIYSDSHKELYQKYFLPSFNLYLNKHELIPIKVEQKGTGEYEAPGFDKTMMDKINSIIDNLDVKDDRLLCYADCDVQFFGDINVNELMGKYDIVFQMDSDDIYCAGFFICNQSYKVLNFFKLVRDELGRRFNGVIHDQIIINDLIRNNQHGIEVGKLDKNEFWTIANSIGGVWNGTAEFNVPSNLIVHHANWTIGIDNKLKLLNLIRQKYNDINNV